MLLKLIFVYLLLGCACGISYTYSGRYGGWGGRSFSQFCPSGTYIDKIQLRTGRLIDAVRVHCVQYGWERWAGGNGGGFRTITSTPHSPEFCGFSVKTGRLVDRLCLRDPTGYMQCHGGHGGGWNTQNHCQGNQGKVLVGIRGRSGRLVDQIQFVFADRDGIDFNNGRLLQEEVEEDEVQEAEGCHLFDDQEDCEDGGSCVFFVPPQEMFDTLADQGRLFACWNIDECTSDEAGQTTCA